MLTIRICRQQWVDYLYVKKQSLCSQQSGLWKTNHMHPTPLDDARYKTIPFPLGGGPMACFFRGHRLFQDPFMWV